MNNYAILFSVLAIGVAIIGHLFRNQLAKVGDSLAANNWRLGLKTIILLIQYGFPTYLMIRVYREGTFDKDFVINVAILTGTIFYQLSSDLNRWYTRNKVSSELATLELKNALATLTRQEKQMVDIIAYWKGEEPSKESQQKISDAEKMLYEIEGMKKQVDAALGMK